MGNVEADTQIILRTIRRVSELGLALADLSIQSEEHLELIVRDDNLKQIKDASSNLSISIEHVYVDFLRRWIFNKVPEGQEKRSWARVSKLTEALGVTTIEIVSPGVSINGYENRADAANEVIIEGSWNDLWQNFVARILEFTRVAERNRFRLAIEPRPREVLSSSDSLLRLLEAVQSENLGGIVDISHLTVGKEIPAVAITKIADKIFGVHISDNDGVTEWHWAPGEGQIDWMPVFESLRNVNYDGELSLDVSGMDAEQEVIEGKRFITEMLDNLKIPISKGKSRQVVSN
jgi:sugar phosphate isomerase/epimerase